MTLWSRGLQLEYSPPWRPKISYKHQYNRRRHHYHHLTSDVSPKKLHKLSQAKRQKQFSTNSSIETTESQSVLRYKFTVCLLWTAARDQCI
jgi:hypothetical protein